MRPEPQPAPAPTSGPVHMLTLADRGACKWPLWDHQEPTTFMFCGARTEVDAAYCKFHSQIAYNRPQERRDATSR
jgi:hypothetical protein